MPLDFATQLNRAGLKCTPSRLAVLTVLDAAERPLSAQQIFEQLQARACAATLSTVYRNLEALVAKGLINQLTLSGITPAQYELNRDLHHHYLTCVHCHKIRQVQHCPLDAYETRLQAETGFLIIGHHLDVHGICPDCLARTAPDSAPNKPV